MATSDGIASVLARVSNGKIIALIHPDGTEAALGGGASSSSPLELWTLAKGRVLSGTGRAKVLILTDSYGIGNYTTRFWASMAKALQGQGLGINYYIGATCNQSTLASMQTQDPRILASSGSTSFAARNSGIGRGSICFNNVGDTVTIKPGVAFDSLDIGLNVFNNTGLAGKVQVAIDVNNIGAFVNIGSLLDSLGSSDTVTISTLSGLSGNANSVLKFTSVAGGSGGGLCFIHSILPYVASQPAVDIFFSAQAGVQIFNYVGASAPYQSATFGTEWYPASAIYKFDLVINTQLINESITATSAYDGSYYAALTSLINRIKQWGSAVIVRPPRSAVTGIPLANQEAQAAQQKLAASDNGALYVDYSVRWGTWEKANTQYPNLVYFDDRHLTNAGQGDMGAVLGSLL